MSVLSGFLQFFIPLNKKAKAGHDNNAKNKHAEKGTTFCVGAIAFTNSVPTLGWASRMQFAGNAKEIVVSA